MGIRRQEKRKNRLERIDFNFAVFPTRHYIDTEHPEVYLFNSQVTKNGSTQPMSTNGVGWAVKESRSKINTNKKITAHILRHTYATHLLEDGMNILRLKELLGHARIETTLIYLHVADIGSSQAFSPLDTLYNED